MAQRGLAARVAGARPARASGSHVSQARPVSALAAVGQAKPAAGLARRHSAAPAAAQSPPPVLGGEHLDQRALNEGVDAGVAYGDTVTGLQGDWAAYEARLGGNPYSQADLLQAEHAYWSGGANSALGDLMRGRDAGYRGVTNGAGLGLYSGATAGNHLRVGTQFLGNLGSIQRDYTIAGQQRERAEEQARHELEAQQNAIREGALQRWEESQPSPVAAGGSAPSGPGASTTVTVVNPRTGQREKKKIGISTNRRA
jgi:hypothetical protein